MLNKTIRSLSDDRWTLVLGVDLSWYATHQTVGFGTVYVCDLLVAYELLWGNCSPINNRRCCVVCLLLLGVQVA